MAKVLAKLGRIRCHCCGSLVVLKKQANGNPIYTCQECDFKAQAFSADSGRRLLAQCVETFGESVNDSGHVVDTSAERPVAAAAPVAGEHEKKGGAQVPPKKQSLGAALGALLDM